MRESTVMGSNGRRSTRACLLALYGCQRSSRYVVSPDSILRNAAHFRNGIERENRTTAFRLYTRGVFQGCLACGKRVPVDSAGDHIWPICDGGPENAGNFQPLCGRCNNSKGKSEFLEWWIACQGRHATELPADAIAAYCRIAYARAARDGVLDRPAPEALHRAAGQLYAALPSKDHRRALLEAIK